MGSSVVSYGHGTQAYYQVMAALIPSLTVLVFINTRKATHGYTVILAHYRSLWRIALHAERLGIISRVVIGFGVVFEIVITVTLPLAFPIIGEIVTLFVLYHGHATQVEANWPAVAVFALGACLIISFFLGNLPEMREKTAEELATTGSWFHRQLKS